MQNTLLRAVLRLYIKFLACRKETKHTSQCVTCTIRQALEVFSERGGLTEGRIASGSQGLSQDFGRGQKVRRAVEGRMGTSLPLSC